MQKFLLAGILLLLSGAVAGTSFVQANGETIAKINETGVYYVHSDNIGSTSAITNEAGKVVEEQLNLPFGEKISGSEKYGFTGKELDETDLQYFGARYYSPLTGRFLTVDPAMDGVNWYSYAANNPLKFIDPDGRKFIIGFTNKPYLSEEDNKKWRETRTPYMGYGRETYDKKLTKSSKDYLLALMTGTELGKKAHRSKRMKIYVGIAGLAPQYEAITPGRQILFQRYFFTDDFSIMPQYYKDGSPEFYQKIMERYRNKFSDTEREALLKKVKEHEIMQALIQFMIKDANPAEYKYGFLGGYLFIQEFFLDRYIYNNEPDLYKNLPEKIREKAITKQVVPFGKYKGGKYSPTARKVGPDEVASGVDYVEWTEEIYLNYEKQFNKWLSSHSK